MKSLEFKDKSRNRTWLYVLLTVEQKWTHVRVHCVDLKANACG